MIYALHFNIIIIKVLSTLWLVQEVACRNGAVTVGINYAILLFEREKHCFIERSLTLHVDSGVGVQRLPKHRILCLQTQQRQIGCCLTTLHQ